MSSKPRPFVGFVPKQFVKAKAEAAAAAAKKKSAPPSISATPGGPAAGLYDIIEGRTSSGVGSLPNLPPPRPVDESLASEIAAAWSSSPAASDDDQSEKSSAVVGQSAKGPSTAAGQSKAAISRPASWSSDRTQRIGAGGKPAPPKKPAATTSINAVKKRLSSVAARSTGAHKGAPPPVKQTDMFKAAERGDRAMLQRCMDGGLDVNGLDVFGWTPLMTAACAGQASSVKWLMQNGADPTIKDRSGKTAASLAEKKKFVSLAKILRSTFKPVVVAQQPKAAVSADAAAKPVDVAAAKSKPTTSIVDVFERNQKEGPPPTVYGIPESNKGFQMMVSGGWEKNRGLGPQGDGKLYPVKTVLKRDRAGLGQQDDDGGGAGEDGSKAPASSTADAAAKKARVTHFGPNDTNSVKGPGDGGGGGDRVERTNTLERARQDQERFKAARKEQTYRNMLGGL